MNNIFNNIKNIYKKYISYYISFTLGALITFFFIYYRFIRERPYGPINSEYSTIKYWLLILSILTFYILIVYTLIFPFYMQMILKEYDGKKAEEIAKELEKNKIRKYIIYSINYIRETTKLFSDPIIRKFIKRFPRFSKNCVIKIIKINPYFDNLSVVFCFSPQLIIAVIFLTETIYYNSYKYFPYSIFLMIFAVLWRLLVYVLCYFCEDLEQNLFSLTIKSFTDPDTGEDCYSWHENAPLCVSQEELDSPEILREAVYMMLQFREYYKIFIDWKLFLFGSKIKRKIQILTYFLLLVAACVKFILLQ